MLEVYGRTVREIKICRIVEIYIKCIDLMRKVSMLYVSKIVLGFMCALICWFVGSKLFSETSHHGHRLLSTHMMFCTSADECVLSQDLDTKIKETLQAFHRKPLTLSPTGSNTNMKEMCITRSNVHNIY